MEFSQQLIEKWKPVLDHPSLPEINDSYRKKVTAILLENQEQAIAEQRMVEQSGSGLLTEASPTTNTGSAAGGAAGFSSADTTNRQGYDPILISMIRRSAPAMIAYDLVGVQPMSGPTGLIFYMKSNYVNHSLNPTALGDEALFNEPQTSGSASVAAATTGTTDNAAGIDDTNTMETDPFATDYYGNSATSSGEMAGSDTVQGMTTSRAEALGDAAGNDFREMSFSIEKTSVTAVSRALKAEYTTELAQDLKAIHGLDAEAELANILSTEILAELNRAIIRTVNGVAKAGAQVGTTTGGVFDLDTDSNGRWSVEKFKGLMFQIERDANAIAVETRRGRGNVILCSADVAAALSMAGSLDTGGSLGGGQLSADGITGNTFVGTLNGKYQVHVDPYFSAAANAREYLTVGYKGTSPFDAGVFYCPYVPLSMVKATGEQTFQPKIGFKTRYGLVGNPFGAGTPNNGLSGGTNTYYRKIDIRNLA